jgi:CRISPR/Cas system CMR-associated protein Cmr3 (group 5 of RAMP superfamily)
MGTWELATSGFVGAIFEKTPFKRYEEIFYMDNMDRFSDGFGVGEKAAMLSYNLQKQQRSESC